MLVIFVIGNDQLLGSNTDYYLDIEHAQHNNTVVLLCRLLHTDVPCLVVNTNVCSLILIDNLFHK